jgi:hypothetical protein
MTIQNIEDVMDRIMSLNKNLTEDSLQTLLSASGWDKEDILEGLHFFKSNRGNVAPISPIQNPVQNKIPTPASAPVTPIIPEAVNIPTPPVTKVDTIENNYSLNIKPVSSYSIEDGIKEIKTESQNSIDHTISDIPVAPTPGIIPPAPTVVANNSNNSTTSIISEHKNNSTGKIIFFILLILILSAGVFYLYSSSFGTNGVTKIDNSQNNTAQQDVQITPIVPDQNSSSTVQDSPVVSTTDNVDNNLSSSQIADLIKEVNALKAQVASYQKTTKSGQTIIKYLSQRGPTGPAGRGVASVDATTTGFLINYTDHTTAIIPYSTTTILNILNSGTVCFRDMNSTSTSQPQNDVCLDRNAVIKILNK